MGGLPTCPVDGNCQATGVVYQASVTELGSGQVETYTGTTARRFKDRLYEHNTNMNNETGRTETALSAHIWSLKDQGKQYEVKWKIRCRGSDYNPRTKKCRICLREKHFIMYDRSGCSLNKRSEVFNTCRHKRTKLLENVKTWVMYVIFFFWKFQFRYGNHCNFQQLMSFFPLPEDCMLVISLHETSL